MHVGDEMDETDKELHGNGVSSGEAIEMDRGTSKERLGGSTRVGTRKEASEE